MTSDLEGAYAVCEKIAAEHYENFTVASRVLPRSERCHLAALYAYARGADDIADEPGFPGDRAEALDAWEARLDDALAGRPAPPVFLATAHTVAARNLSDEPLRALLRAFRYDVAFAPFADFAALRAYCANSADPVGRLVLGLFGIRDDALFALSDDVCTGLQLANFWQDLSVDLAQERCYLPLDEIAALPGATDALARRESNEAFVQLLAQQLERTRRLLESGDVLADQLPMRAALQIRLFARGGLRIVAAVEALGGNILQRRPSLERSDFVRVLLAAFRRSVSARRFRRGTPGRPVGHADERRKEFA